MRPGENATVTLVMLNRGENAQFALTVNATAMGSNRTVTTDSLEYYLTPSTVFLQQDSSTEIIVEISLSGNVTDGLEVAFTVIAASLIGNENNFINFYVLTTTRPPPEFTENVSHRSCVGIYEYS